MTLRNCPVCGNHDLSFYSQGMARQNEIEVWFIEKPERIIECNTCGHLASGWDYGKTEEEWNTKEPDEWELDWWHNNANCKKNG